MFCREIPSLQASRATSYNLAIIMTNLEGRSGASARSERLALQLRSPLATVEFALAARKLGTDIMPRSPQNITRHPERAREPYRYHKLAGR
jgi:hypothetical protein